MKKSPFKIHSIWLIFLIAIYFTFALNFSLAKEFSRIIQTSDVSLPFIISIPILFIAFFSFLFIPFSFRLLLKPFFILLILITSVVDYASFNYGIIFDSDMIANIAQTNVSESTSYLNMDLLFWFAITGIIPALLLLKINIQYSKFVKGLIFKFLAMLISAGIIGIVALFFYKDYASVGRNNSGLLYKINPTYYISGTFKYINKTYFYTPMEYEKIGADAKKIDRPINSNQKDLLVYIVGETARAQNYELNGYNKATNRYSRDIANLISFQDVYSCGTATAISLPCMFSSLNRQEYSRDKFDHQDNLVDVFNYAGIPMVWIENNTGCKGICKHIETIDISRLYSEYCENGVCTDDIFLNDLDDRIEKLKATGGIIFLHIMGSHGPTYFKRVPDQFKEFKPECAKSDIQNCTDEQIVNTYDNTILFTDYVMTEIINKLKEPENNIFNSALFYVSDHGESLGEGGVYLHGMPYALASEYQTKVPMILWLSDSKIADDKLNVACLKDKANKQTFSHDNLFHSLLSLMNIQTKVLNENLDFLHDCKNSAGI